MGCRGLRLLSVGLANSLCLLTLVVAAFLPLDLRSAEDLETHRFRFFLHPDLVEGLPADSLKSRLVLYVEDLNTIFSKQTIRRFTFDPDTDITITTNAPYTGQGGEPPTTNFEVWAHAVLSTNVAFGTYGGFGSLDVSGAGVAAGLHWDAVHDRSTLLTGSGYWELTQYWRQIHHLTHEIEHIFGAGLGEYYDLREVNDSTGVAPLLDINYDVNGVNDPYWSLHTDYFTDPLFLWTPDLSYSNLMSQVRFAEVTAAVLNARKRPGASGSGSLDSTLPDLTRTKLLVRDTQSGAAIPNAEVRIWKVGSVSPSINELIVSTNTDAYGSVEFNWSGELSNFDQAMVIKVYHPGIHLPAVRWSSIYEAQEAKMIGHQDHFEVSILLSPDPGPAVAPFIVQQPKSGTNGIGTTASFSVVADGTPPLSYRWQFNGTNLVEDGNIVGSTNPTLTILSAQPTNAGSYAVEVSNVAGGTNSEPATLSVIGLIQSWVKAATNGQVIPIPAGTYVENVVIDKDVILVGAGPAVTIVDGNQAGRVFFIQTNRTVAISGLTIQHGDTDFANPSSPGGGGVLSEGDLSLSNCVVRANKALGAGLGGGICSLGANLLLDHVSVLDNRLDRAGGIFFHGGQLIIQNSLISSNRSAHGGGGVYLEAGTLEMRESGLDGNASDGGGGIYFGTNTTAVIENSTISRNEGATGGGGGVFNRGTVTLRNSTVSGNFCDEVHGGAGIRNFAPDGALTLESCTITSNHISYLAYTRGGGVFGSLVARNTIIAGNSANIEDFGNDVFGTITSQGYNLIGNTNGATLAGDLTGNLLGVDPLLGPLQDNGGPTPTHALLPGSPAIDQGSAGGVTMDQRGVSRPVNDLTIPNAADGSDIGAFELATVTPVFPPVVTQQPESRTNLVGTTATFRVVADGTEPKGYQWQFNGTNLTDGGNIVGSTVSTLTISSVQRINAGSYRVVVSNVAGGTNSAPATLSVIGLIQSWVNTATNGQVIPIPAGTYVENVMIDKDVILVGAGPEMTIVDGNQADRVFFIQTNRTVAISGLTIQHGTAGFAAPGGGGIYSEGNLKLVNCVISENGISIYNTSRGGGVCSGSGELTVTNCVVRQNSGYLGGGIYSSGGAVVLSGVTLAQNVGDRAGGLYFEGGQLSIQTSLISSNSSGHGGGGLYLEGGTFNMDRSVVDGNLSDGGGGLVVGENSVAFIGGSTISRNYGANTLGGGILNLGTLSLANSTVSGNIADDQGGGGIYNSSFAGGSLAVESCTITGNQGGDHGRGGGVAGAFTARNTIIAGNSGDIDHRGNDIFGVMTSQGYNLIGDTNDMTITGDLTGNLPGVDPLLGPLQDNGGPTPTHALLTGSPAIDQGSAGGLAADQRGVSRPVDDLTIPNAADGSDIGAVEQRALSLSGISVSGDGRIEIRIEGDPGLSYELQVSRDFVHWQTEAVVIAGPDGLATYSLPVSTPAPAGFFRLFRL